MAQISWVNLYIRETSRNGRIKLLDEAIAEEGLTEENALRRQIFEERHVKEGGMDIDRFIRGWINFNLIENSMRGFMAKKRTEKEMNQIRKDLQLNVAQEHGAVGEKILEQEFRNLTWVYAHLCATDKTYSSVILGIGRMKEETLISKIARDCWRVAYDLPRLTGTTEEMRVFTRGVTEGFCEIYPDHRHFLMDRIQ